MANKKITELTEETSPQGADLLALVDDVSGTPTTKKVTVSNLMTQAPVQAADISGLATQVSLGNHEALTSSVHGISAFGATLVDDADAATARTTLDVDQAGTDNSTDVTLATVANNYLSLSGQEITAGVVPVSLGGTGSGDLATARANLGLGTAATTASTDYATAAQGTLADSATQPGDNISTLTNDSGYLTSFTETNDLTAAVTWANVPDANITQSSVTQHQAALSLTESQISDLGTYVTKTSATGSAEMPAGTTAQR